MVVIFVTQVEKMKENSQYLITKLGLGSFLVLRSRLTLFNSSQSQILGFISRVFFGTFKKKF